ncbi:MAG: leucine-rich repeat domain-containing protein, partial [Clostridia bacterium]|nr:leucine-rich repeat domain-containing protein [Clostridia bacterium]
MKKRLLFLTVLVVALVALLAISASAAVVYKTADGTTLFSYVDANSDYDFDSYEGSFPKTDADGNHLTWYITATATEGSDTVHTVASLKTVGEAGSINASGAYTYTSPVTNKNTVSVNFPDNAGIKTIPAFGGYGTRSQNNVLFAYLPNTLTELPESLFQETPVIVGEIDDETPVTFIPHKLCHEARNIETVNIPASATVIKSQDDRNGATFCNTLSLKTVTFAPNSKLTRIHQYAFYGSGIEEIQFPDSLVAVNQNLFRNCKNLKVLRFGANFQYFENVNQNDVITTNHHSLTHTATALQEIYLPASFYTSKPETNYKVSYAFDGCSNAKFFFVGTKAQLDTSIANFVNAEWTTGATDHNYILDAYNANKIVSWSEYSQNPENYTGRYIITDYNKCDAFYKGEHTLSGNDCTKSVVCTKECGYGFAPVAGEHKIEKTLAYANGFDKAGVYSCVCSNAEYCTAIEGYTLSEAKDPIITFKGYSTPETGNVKGINAGFKVEKDLLTLYNDLNEVDATLTIFMVNSKSNDVNISKILDGDTLELADGVKGINVKITSVNYTSISVEVRGFDDSEGGNFYTLNLITAIAVKTADG